LSQPARRHRAQGRQRARGYAYSPATKNANATWTDDTLSKYLSDPKAFIQATRWRFAGIKDPSRLGDLLAYLNQATK
jgi:cytochrome c